MADFASMFTWRDPESDEAQLGDGISRAVPGEPTEPYVVMVKLPGARPMRLTLHAESLEHAIRYASARWPKGLVYAAQPEQSGTDQRHAEEVK